ncbi:MAG: threonine--tRNA ligase [candidate division Zixibacteria bacterium]|nr:threonine--tRNA ligase [candidate division Zixibacteria bacterium]
MMLSPIEEGFYYDFEVPEPFSPEDLEKIEARMGEIVAEKAPFTREEVNHDEILKLYQERGETYKVDLLENTISDETVSIYTQSRFRDLCRGPHIPHTGFVKAFKLTSSSGAYWRGDERNTMLQRIYGVSYPKRGMLDKYLGRMEEAKKRDHRILGKQLELIAISDEIGPGLILWLPKGARVRNEIENFWREEHLKAGYELVYSPHVARLGLWEKSGHTEFYRESMFPEMKIDNNSYQLKPMNCPFHMAMYRTKRRSYRDLPLRWAELGTVYRYERPGVLHGLMRVRGFTQDDAHHFVEPDKIDEELDWLISFCLHILKSFGFTEFEVSLSTRPEKKIGADADWESAEKGLRKALQKAEIDFTVDEGGGAFYGPKIDIIIKDALGRRWQCSTIQFDFSLPERFDLSYVDSSGELKRPLMIHRALLGSIERFFGVLLENFAGDFPLWLAPIQARILPITDELNTYAGEVMTALKKVGIRVETDTRSEKIGHKIREAELMKIPYMLIIGGRERDSGAVSVRRRGEGDLGAMGLNDLITRLETEIKSKALSPKKQPK